MNLHSTGNSGNRNRKWPRLAILATTTAAVLLSTISFIGVGAIPQPQQAFGDANVMQSISQSAFQNGTATD